MAALVRGAWLFLWTIWRGGGEPIPLWRPIGSAWRCQVQARLAHASSSTSPGPQVETAPPGATLPAVLADPMCGSGTFLIEAALMATDVAPGSFRRWWPFTQARAGRAGTGRDQGRGLPRAGAARPTHWLASRQAPPRHAHLAAGCRRCKLV